MSEKAWLITGTSKGFGRVWAEAALDRGDKVAATARDTKALALLVEKYGDSVLPIALDVTDRRAVFAAAKQTADKFGRIDVAINNAGYGHFGMVEEATEEEARAQIETNVFGALWVTQAVLPYMREQKYGHILQVSSLGGVNAFPNLGLYHASKWALEGFSQSLAAEVGPELGIRVTLIEPALYSTDWAGDSAVRSERIAGYDEPRARIAQATAARRATPGDPQATADAILKVVDSDEPPLRLFLGKINLDMTRDEYERRIEEWEKWDDTAQAAHTLP